MQKLNTSFTKEGIGDDVLFLHGWGGNKDSFKAVYSRLKNFAVTSIDLWGFGDSSPPNSCDGWQIEDYANCLADFVREQGLKNLTVVGHSFGGRVAVVFAAKYPRMLKRLVLVSAAGLKRFNPKTQFKIWLYKLKKLRAKHSKKQADLLNNYGSADYKACKGVMRSTFVKVTKQRLDAFARQIKCPTLLIWGQKDTQTPLWMAKKYRRLVKNSGLVVLKDCDHFCYLQNINLFMAVLNSFLNSGT